MTSATLIRSLLGASSALAMTMCQAPLEPEGPDERGAADPQGAIGTFVNASWNANIDPRYAACVRVRIQPRSICYNPKGAPTAPGIQLALRQTANGGLWARTYTLHSPIDQLAIYNLASSAILDLQLQFPSGAAVHGCAAGLALSSIPSGIVEQSLSKISFEPGGVWGGTGVPPAPFTDCNSALYVTM